MQKLSIVHLEDEASDRNRFHKEIFPELRERFRTFLKDTFSDEASEAVKLELRQVSSVQRMVELLMDESWRLKGNGDGPVFFMLDYYVPETKSKGAKVKELPDCQVRSGESDKPMPFFSWLKLMFPAVPKVILTSGSDTSISAEKKLDSGYIQKSKMDNPDDFGRHMRQFFDDWWTPSFWRSIKKYSEDAASDSWHTPGHNAGNAFRRSDFQNDFYECYGKGIFQTDLSVSVPNLGDLSEPDMESPLNKSLKRTAKIFGARETFYITNGTSSSNKALLMTLMQPGDVVLLDRNCHKSVHQAVVMSGSLPLYVNPGFNTRLGVWQPISYPTLQKYIGAEYPSDIKPRMLILTTCTYEGILYPVNAIANLCERREMLLFADEAWAPYMRFHDFYVDRERQTRYNAVDAGAHFIVHSTHKALAAFSQASMIHVSSRFVERLEGQGSEWRWLRDRFSLDGNGSYKRFRHELLEVLRYWHSTSPHYPMLSTLDRAGIQMRLEGINLLGKRLKWAEEVEQVADSDCENACSVGIKELVGEMFLNEFPGYKKDPLKVVLGFKNEGAGKKFEELLKEWKIQSEKTTSGCVEFLITIGTFHDHIEDLKRAISEGVSRDLLGRPDAKKLTASDFDFNIAKGQVEVLPRSATSHGELVTLEKSIGRISAQMVVPYPPGIPVFLPGLRITKKMTERIAAVIHSSGLSNVHGLFQEGEQFFVKVMSKSDEERALKDPLSERIKLLRNVAEGIENERL